jgi:hypothetical protein
MRTLPDTRLVATGVAQLIVTWSAKPASRPSRHCPAVIPGARAAQMDLARHPDPRVAGAGRHEDGPAAAEGTLVVPALRRVVAYR